MMLSGSSIEKCSYLKAKEEYMVPLKAPKPFMDDEEKGCDGFRFLKDRETRWANNEESNYFKIALLNSLLEFWKDHLLMSIEHINFRTI